ncbi:hypothetical protein BS50DRAFT_310277 [Corynespora cassiicola Philippines]|uniref:Zn(2)-C6 fungal-type domain-containing protein n=1 Tax=Corynespora cassiicola Philippines TaxID=1448308 RepID=A0A2T2NY77_CORCC|nr:hypothetical protein BS50DRAFT_310277 [Corynespora cassiicola Philippines]
MRPRRSKGCVTCRRRKVKCDESKPLCTRCQKAGIECDGYITNTNHNRIVIYRPAAGDQERDTKVQIPEPIGLSGFKENIWLSYTATTLLYTTGPLSKSANSFIFALGTLSPTSVAYSAACCFSAQYFAQTHHLAPAPSSPSSSTTTATQYYCRALSALNTALNDPSQWSDPYNVIATFLLGLYELVSDAQGLGWIQHAGGVGKLIEMRGPEAHSAEPALTYLMLSRLPIILTALAEGRRTFLEGADWRSASFRFAVSPAENPWAHLQEEVVDVLAQVPGFLEELGRIGQLERVDGEKEKGIERLRGRLVEAMRWLFGIRFKAEIVLRDIAYEVPLSMNPGEEKEKLFDTMIFYRDIVSARTPMFYDMVLLVLLSLAAAANLSGAAARALSTLPCPQPSHSDQSSVLLLPSSSITMDDVACEIARSVDYHLQPHLMSAGAFSLIVPLRIMTETMPEGKWKSFGEASLKRIAATHSLRFCAKMANIDEE